MFASDYPRGVVNRFWLWRFAAFGALAVASALTVSFLLSCRRLPVSFLRLPTRPFPRRLPARLAAITLASLIGMEVLLASLEQTPPPRPACQSPPPARKCLHK